MKKRLVPLMMLLLILDLYLKNFAQTHWYGGQELTVIPGFFTLTYVENTGAAWSMLEGQRLFFIVLSIAAAIAMIYYYVKEDKLISILALALLISGNFGNLYDRLMYGYVRDMLSFNIFGYAFPVFNLADSYLTIGVILIIIDMFLEERGFIYGKKDNY